MSKKTKPIRQATCARYTISRLGLQCGSGAGGYALTCQALEMDGLAKPLGISAKHWVFQNAAHIRTAVGALPAPKKRRKTYGSPPILSVVPGAKWTAKASITTFRGGKVDVRSDDFLQSYEWRVLRMQALKLHGPRCQCCGATPADGVVMNVDHIKPRRLFPELALTLDNLQILCGPCNHGKSNWDQTDWRNQESDDLEPEQRQHLAAIR